MRPSKSWRKEVASLRVRSVFFWPSDKKWRSISRVRAPPKPSKAAKRESEIETSLRSGWPPGGSKLTRLPVGQDAEGGNAAGEDSSANKPTLRIGR